MISDALGVTQAALYKHFSSKDALIEEVFRTRYLDEKPSDFSSILDATDEPLNVRLLAAYVSFFNNITETSFKLFQRASYDGLEIAKQYSPHLDTRILWPVLSHLRHACELPTLTELAASREERELVMMLHSTIVFLALRRYVYGIDFKGNEPTIIKLHVDTWLAGSMKSMAQLHGRSN